VPPDEAWNRQGAAESGRQSRQFPEEKPLCFDWNGLGWMCGEKTTTTTTTTVASGCRPFSFGCCNECAKSRSSRTRRLQYRSNVRTSLVILCNYISQEKFKNVPRSSTFYSLLDWLTVYTQYIQGYTVLYSTTVFCTS
jgi:hypothetical protein